jgi:hypothetical protein
MQRITQLWKSGIGGKLAIGCGGLIVLLLLCYALSTLSGQGPTRQAAPATVQVAKTEATTEAAKVQADTPKPTNIPQLTSTPKPTNTPPPTNTPKPPTATPTPLPKIGQTVSVGNWEYTVTKVEKEKTLTWSEFGNTSEAKGTWLIVYMTLKNIGKQNFGINTWDFELRDASDIKYDTSTDFGTTAMFLSYKKLSNLGEQYPPGVPVNTALIFDIAPDAKGLKLVLKQARTSVDLGE